MISRRLRAGAVVLAALLLGGCAMTAESRLDDYRAEAERLHERVVEEIPVELLADGAEPVSERRVESTSAEGAASDPAWWQVADTRQLIEDADASASAASAVDAYLVSEGWTAARVRETEGGQRLTDGYRRDGWYVEVSHVEYPEGMAQRIEVLVVSPETVRGG